MRLVAIATTSSPCRGLILNASGNGLLTSPETMSGAVFFISWSASSFEMYSTPSGPMRGSFWSFMRMAFFCAVVTSAPQVVVVQR